jgi:dTDP-4-amino-4,6-dideoxygalactose transaminase
MNELLERNWLTNYGPFVRELETRISDMIGVKHCIVMCNGTIAMEIAIRALGLTGEVIVPSMTFIATAHALQWQEITPVFCDINPSTFNIDPRRVEQMITPRTSGIVGVHLWGRPCAIEALTEIAQRWELKLLFDAAHAFGCTYKGRMIGGFGDAEVFSFHATKCFNTYEGGAVVTNDDELATKIRLMKNFGFRGNDNVIYIGTNGKMTEMAAAMGLTSLESLETFIEVNQRNYILYKQELAEIPGVQLVRYDEKEKNNYHYIVLDIDEKQTGLNRDLMLNILEAENVIARRYFYPGCHNMQPYKSYFPQSHLWLPETEEKVKRVLILPTGMAVQPKSIELICAIIRLVLTNGLLVKNRMEKIKLEQEQVAENAGIGSVVGELEISL